MNRLKKRQKMASQQGNAIIITLLVIALLTGLTFSISKMSSKTSGNLNAEQARIAAENIMRTAQSYEGAVQKLMNINRCSENEFNFDNTFTSLSHTNPSAPPANRCDVFAINGAGFTYSPPNTAHLEPADSAKSLYGEWVYYSTQCILEIGSGDTSCNDANTDLMIILPHIKKEICTEINNLNTVTNPSGNPPQEDIATISAGFVGDYSADLSDPEIGEGATGTPLIRHATGCYQDNNGAWINSYVFYHVILVR